MKIYDTITRYKEELRTIEPGKVRMYVCGPMVYNLIHIGNVHPMVFFDTVRRYLEYKGYRVNFVSNFIDVDGKIIKVTNEGGVDASVISECYIVECKKDMTGVSIRPASYSPRATEEIPGMIEMIQKLIDSGHAYVAADSTVYYRVGSFPDYGKLSHENVEENQAGPHTLKVCGEETEEDPNGFVLWKPKKEDKPYWKSPWYEGRPGWHVECSAMNKKYLGETIDIHSGSKDLMFPYHENEIAQSEAVSGKKSVCYWTYNAFLNVDNVKMSKSFGNFKTVRQISKECNLQVLRFFVLSAYYRSLLNFPREMMGNAKAGLGRILTAMEHLRDCLAATKAEALTGAEEEGLATFGALRGEFEATMDDDFNIVDAISVIFEMVKRTNIMATEESSKAYITHTKGLLSKLLDALSLLSERKGENLDARVEALIAERQTVRKEKNLTHTDEIRSELTEVGILLEDTKENVRWKRA